jgi:hypothetical protein
MCAPIASEIEVGECDHCDVDLVGEEEIDSHTKTCPAGENCMQCGERLRVFRGIKETNDYQYCFTCNDFAQNLRPCV